MRSLIILLAVCAMASASDRHGSVNVVDNARPNNGQGQIIDPGFYRPSTYPTGGLQKSDISPAWVQPGNGNAGNNDYRPKKFDDPRLRGGK